MVKALYSFSESFGNFVDILPTIGICLLGIFAVTGVIILTVKLLNKFSAWLESRKEEGE